jgi:hypothetical protein
MAAPTSGGSGGQGICSLEVRWILPGQLDMAVAEWFVGPTSAMESREDAYLSNPHLDGLSVKVRAGRALEVKVFRGSPGILDLPGRARGRMQYWQKWSFPFHPLSQNGSAPGGWTRVRKQRRISQFSLTEGRITARARGLTGDARCAVELTEVRTHHQDWWSLGLEATGRAGLLRAGLEATAAFVFTYALPGGAELRMDDSASYAEWLDPQLSSPGDDRRGWPATMRHG